MADQQKGKNRAAILQELESIKGLLVDEEEIPVLQEVIDTAEAQLESGESVDEEDLQELQQAYRDLLQAQDNTGSEEEIAPDTPTVEPTANETAVKAELQTSLFATDFSELEDQTSAPSDEFAVEAKAPESEADKPLDLDRRGSSARRPGVTKATGENPFLPAHIRARLHGNRPPPLFEPHMPPPAPTVEASKSSEPGDRVNRALLTDELVAEFLPQIEAALRDRLQAMTEEQILQLSSRDKVSQEAFSQDSLDDSD